MLTMNECAEFLRSHDSFFVITHVRPDGDSLCSAAALCAALRRRGARAVMYRNPEVTESYYPLVEPFLGEWQEGDCIVSVDVADVTMFPKGWDGKIDLAIDHHPKNPGYAGHTLVDGSKAACGELVMQLIEMICGDLTKEEAELLYVAVSTDSGCFSYGNTTAETLRDAAHLIDCGAVNGVLNKQFFRSYSFQRLKLEGMIFSGMRSFRGGKINVAVVTLNMMKESGAIEDDCDDLASLTGRVRGSRVNITIRELEEGKCKVSLRTSEAVDASAICERFGGGGHKMAAGCTLNADPETAMQMILGAVNEIWPE